ncbi:thioredoxin family protein [Oceanihabitans sediminis]
MKEIIRESLDKSISYSEYLDVINTQVANNDTSGENKSEDLVAYTKLNAKRMKRWDKTLKVSEEAKAKIEKLDKKVTWLVLTETWCGDAAHVLPVINKVAETSENISLGLVFRDENEALMNQFLTNGGKSIPKLIMIEETSGEVFGSFGPRPKEATQLVLDYKEKHGAISAELKENLQVWYNKDKGQSTVNDLVALLTKELQFA